MNESFLGKKIGQNIILSQLSSESTLSPNSNNINLNSPTFSPIEIIEEIDIKQKLNFILIIWKKIIQINYQLKKKKN